jgi:hypothetical protein
MRRAAVTAVLAAVFGLSLICSIGASAQMGQGMMGGSGTAWGAGAFRSNGERIYFTATSERGTAITYTGGPGARLMSQEVV